LTRRSQPRTRRRLNERFLLPFFLLPHFALVEDMQMLLDRLVAVLCASLRTGGEAWELGGQHPAEEEDDTAARGGKRQRPYGPIEVFRLHS
jgi:hypothetical protein